MPIIAYMHADMHIYIQKLIPYMGPGPGRAHVLSGGLPGRARARPLAAPPLSTWAQAHARYRFLGCIYYAYLHTYMQIYASI